MKTNTKVITSAVSPHIEDWKTLNWNKINEYVKKLRQRIFRAEQLGQKRKVKKLQRLMMRSKANLLLSIKKVTQTNQGKRTAGVDNYKVMAEKDRVILFNTLKNYNIRSMKPLPAKRVYIPKKNGKLRPLGIPTIKDRVFQNIVKNALEPQWECRFESTSYGFRPKRSTHDAIQSLYLKLRRGTNKPWIFEGDFKGCFDNLNHQYIMECLKGFPSKETIHRWLKAGYVDNNVFNETEAGTPQGGIISPLLANIALHGMEDELGVKYRQNKSGYVLSQDSIGVVKYADDFVVICRNEKEAESIYRKLEPYLTKRGLTLAQDKTRITHISKGFDFLGFNIRQYCTNNGEHLIIKPSKDSIRKAKGKIKEIFNQCRCKPVGGLINKLNPVIRGIGNYWSCAVSKSTYASIDYYMWMKIAKHLRGLHPRKSWEWRFKKYFKSDHTGVSKDHWILTDPKDKTNQIFKMNWIPIERHIVVKYKNSPDDATLKEYFQKRDEREFIRYNVAHKQKLAKKVKYQCRICKQSLVGEEPLEINHIIPRMLGGKNEYKNLELLHQNCHIQHHQLLEQYGGGKELPKVKDYFQKHQTEPYSFESITLMKKAFKKFKYQFV